MCEMTYIYSCACNLNTLVHSHIHVHTHTQVSCRTSTCPQGTYPSTASSTKPPFSGTGQSLLSIVQDVATWCLPCDDVCASCTGPGNTSCTTCRYAQRLAQCVSGCNNDTGNHTPLGSPIFHWVSGLLTFESYLFKDCLLSLQLEYQDAALNCLACAAGCIGCTGPSISQCLKCASGSCANTDLQQYGNCL